MTGLSSGISSELSLMESVSQLVLTVERLVGNPHREWQREINQIISCQTPL